MLTLLWGIDGQENRAEIIRRICRDTQKEQNWIVPEQASFEAERLLCLAGGDQICRSAQVLSFSRLANRVFSVCGGLARQTLDAGGRVLAMAQALGQVRSRLKIYAAGCRRPSFYPQLLTAVEEFQSYGVDARQLRDTARLAGGMLAEKLEELALILESYQAVCAAGHQDPTDRLHQLARALEQGDYARERAFYFDGFFDFTGVELQVIRQLLQAGSSVTVSLCCDGLMQGAPLYALSRRTAQSLMQLADQAHQKTVAQQVAAPDGGEIAFAAREVFAAGQAVWPEPAKQIHLRRCSDAFAEAEAAADTVAALLHDGLRYRDIAIAAADYPGCRSIFEAVFARYEIPVYFAGAQSILQTPLVEMVLSALEAVTGGMEKQSVLCWLKSGLTGLEEADCDALENYAVRWNITGSRWNTVWTAHPAGYDARWTEAAQQELERLNQLRQSALAPLHQLRADLEQAATTGKMVQALYQFLERLELRQTLQRVARQQYDAGQLQSAQQTAQLYEILIGALEQMYALLCEVPATAETFLQLLQVLLEQYDAGTIPATVDSVVVGSVADLRFHTQQAVLLTGCAEDVLPGAPNRAGLLSESERHQLQTYGLQLAPDAWGTLERELLGLYTVMRSARQQMFWFAPQERMSYLFLRMQDLFPQRMREYEEDLYPAALGLPQTLAQEAAGAQEQGLICQAAQLQATPQLQQKIKQLRDQAAWQAGDLQPDTVRQLYGQQLLLSASQIQTYAGCRQAHFLQYGVQLRERKPAEFDAPVYGTFVHAVLEQTVRQVQSEGGFAAVSSEQVERIAKQAMEEITVQQNIAPEQQTERFWHLYRRNFTEILQVVRQLDQELRQSAFVPARCELKFRTGEAMGPVQVQTPAGTALVQGAVDRVDLLHTDHGDYVRVVDYKTGHRDFDYTDILCGMGLQMLLYLFALEENGQREFGCRLKPAGVLYFPARHNLLTLPNHLPDEKIAAERQKDLTRQGLLLDDEQILQAMEPTEEQPRYLPYRLKKDGRTGDLASERQMQLLHSFVRHAVGQIAGQMFAGQIQPNPYERGATGACTYCPYADACHRDQAATQPRRLRTVKAEEFWQELEQKEAENHGEN